MLWCLSHLFLFLHRAKCLLPPSRSDSAIRSLKLSDPELLYLSHLRKCQNGSVDFFFIFTLSHTALLTLKLAKAATAKERSNRPDPLIGSWVVV